MFFPIRLLLAQADSLMNLQPGSIQQVSQAVFRVGLVAHGENISVRAGIRCMNNSKTHFLWQDLGGHGICEDPVVQQVWGYRHKTASGTETTRNLGKCGVGFFEMLHDHATGDQVKAIVTEG